MVNKEWNYGQVNGLDRKLKLVGFNFIEETEINPSITVYLREQVLAPNGAIISDVNADYQVVKGKISYDIEGLPLPKKDLQGNIVYQVDENGNITDIPEERDNGFDNIVYYIDNKIFSIYEMIDAGVIERFKLNANAENKH